MLKKKSIFVTALLAMMLASCGGGSSSSVAPASSSESSEEPSSSATTSAQGEKSPGDANWIYYAENLHCKLALDYVGHSFWTDGIEKVTLSSAIDGDTAHFQTSTGELLKSRFYGIDTPESTGQVQPYGKQASNFTKERLEKAAAKGTIVVSTAQDGYGVPKADSTGSRYVSLIWIHETVKNAPFDQLTLLNRQIVEYGYSWVKAVSDMPEYAPVFYAAEAQAKDYKLKLFSGEDDPYFNYGDYEDVSLLDIKEEVVACLGDPERENAFNNAKVRVQGTVAGYANNIIYIEDFCFYYRQKTNDKGQPLYYDNGEEVTYSTDASGNPLEPVQETYNKTTGEANPDRLVVEGQTGEYAGLNIFKGMSSIPSKFYTLGNYIQVCGLALDSQFGFQVTDGSFKTLAYDDNDAKVLILAADNTDEHALKTFSYTADELSEICKANNYESLNCRVQITTKAKVTGGFNADSGAIYLYLDAYKWSVYLKFTYKPYPDDTAVSWTKFEQFVDHEFIFSGVLAIHQTQAGKNLLYMYPGTSSDIVLQDAK